MADIAEKTRRKTGPKGPSKPLDDLSVVIEMIKIQCTQVEICAVLGISEDTLTRRIIEHNIEGVSNFAGLYEKHSHEGKASLRRAQWKAAHDGNVTMQIWLGKQLLGQKIPKRYLDGDDNLQTMQGYPYGLLAIASDGYSDQRIVDPVEDQKALIKCQNSTSGLQ
jgi:hypothetical protein